jgi:hypothetical protein
MFNLKIIDIQIELPYISIERKQFLIKKSDKAWFLHSEINVGCQRFHGSG